MSEHRTSPRRGNAERRENDDRRAEARLHDRADRRKKNAPVAADRRAGKDRRADSRRRKSRRARQDRRDN